LMNSSHAPSVVLQTRIERSRVTATNTLPSAEAEMD
jgi:hypothetical protein